jgi:hypothetical protein
MKQFNVILSCDSNPLYSQFIPTVCQAWKILFPECKTNLAYSEKINAIDGLKYKQFIRILFEYDRYKLLTRDIAKILPQKTWSQIARHLLATQFKDEIVMLNDIDLIPLQRKYYEQILNYYEDGKIILIGYDSYQGTKDEGKFPMGYATASGNTWKEIINPKNLSLNDLFIEWKFMEKMFDNSENIFDGSLYPSPTHFSDESFLRKLLTIWNHPGRIISLKRGFESGIDSLDRAKWYMNENKLFSGDYVECHCLRPIREYLEHVQPIFEYLQSLDKNFEIEF